MLPPIPDLEFNAAAHRYRYKGEWLPHSVTQIASPKTPLEMERINATKDGPDGWAARGNAVHEALEKHVLGKGVVYDTRWGDWVNPLCDHWLFQGHKVLATEHALVSPKWRVAGSFDGLIETAKGSLVLYDLKTVSSAKAAKTREAARAQLGAYSLMLLDNYDISVNRCVTVVSGPGVVEVKTDVPDECHIAWLDALDNWKLLQPEW